MSVRGVNFICTFPLPNLEKSKFALKLSVTSRADSGLSSKRKHIKLLDPKFSRSIIDTRINKITNLRIFREVFINGSDSKIPYILAHYLLFGM